MAFETVKWGHGRKQEFAAWLHTEIWNTLGDRAQLERKWISLITQFRARVIGDGTCDVPFIGASDVDFPLTAIHAVPVYSDLMQTLHIPQNFWTVSPMRDDMVDVAKPFERFLSIVERNYVKMRHVNTTAFLDLCILGTCVYKDYIHHSARMVKEYGEGDAVQEVRKVEFEPRAEHVRLKDFEIPGYADCINPDDVGGAPWVSHKFELTEDQFRLRAEEGAFLPQYDPKGVKDILAGGVQASSVVDAVKDQMRREDEVSTFTNRKIQLREVWARFPAEDKKRPVDIVVIWHQDTQTILRATYNPFMHGDRPFESAQYIPGFGFFGMGIGEEDEWAQLTQSRLLNSAVNNSLLSNQKMFQVPQGTNFAPDEPIHTGKIWPVGPGEDVKAIAMGEVNGSIFTMMGQMLQWSEGRTGVSDLRQGNMGSMPSRTPASTTLAVLQEGNKKFDMILSNLRNDALANIGRRIVQNLIQISRSDPRWRQLAVQALGPAEGAQVNKVLTGQVNDVRDKLGITVTATSSQVNKEVEKQSYVTLLQIFAQIYPQLMQYAQVQQNPQLVMDIAMAALRGNTELMKRLLENFDIRNPEPFMPDSLEQKQQQPQMPGMAAGSMMGTNPIAPLGQGGFGQSPVPQVLGVG